MFQLTILSQFRTNLNPTLLALNWYHVVNWNDVEEYISFQLEVAPVSTNFFVITPVLPSIEESPGNYTILQGEELLIPCRAEGNPPPRINWYKLPQDVLNHLILPNGALRLVRIISNLLAIY